MKYYQLYYYVKKYIPRWLQIALRRRLARAKRISYSVRWPIDAAGAVQTPPIFRGWPGGKKFALVLRHDIETEKGTRRWQRIVDVERSLGMRSAFFLVPEDYEVTEALRAAITGAGCEIGVHGLKHDGKLFVSHGAFRAQALRINRYIREWGSTGFASPSAHHNFEWLHELEVAYDSSSFDTDPFEPQSDGLRRIFPVMMWNAKRTHSFVELPYTMPQDFTLFVILQERGIDIWKKKLDWVAAHGGMVMVNTHPDYISYEGELSPPFTYPFRHYEELLAHIESAYRGQYWSALPREVAAFWRSEIDI